MPATPDRLASALADLPVAIEGVSCVSTAVDVPSYGGPRPTSTVTLVGDGRRGEGEHVGWTDEAHAAFRAAVACGGLVGRWTIASLGRALRERGLRPYDRAAIETAAVELALRQRETTLAGLAGTAPRPVSYVVSFARVADPSAEAARHPGARLKVDVDPAWPDAVWRDLAATGRVAILDWKGGGDATAYARALARLPHVLHEDPAPPLPPAIAARRSLDAALTDPTVLDGAAPFACNLKPARMGSLLDAVRTAACAARRGILYYVGGMFEIGVGRRQLRELAAVLCPDAPNDLAPIPLAAGAPKP